MSTISFNAHLVRWDTAEGGDTETVEARDGLTAEQIVQFIRSLSVTGPQNHQVIVSAMRAGIDAGGTVVYDQHLRNADLLDERMEHVTDWMRMYTHPEVHFGYDHGAAL